MSWLDGYKQKFDNEIAEKERKIRESDETYQRRHLSACQQLQDFVKVYLQDLVGKKTKDGKILRLEIKENHASLYEDDQPFVALHYQEEERSVYLNGNSYTCGNGQYKLVKNMHLCKPHKNRGGSDENGKITKRLCEETLAHYLLTFLVMNNISDMPLDIYQDYLLDVYDIDFPWQCMLVFNEVNGSGINYHKVNRGDGYAHSDRQNCGHGDGSRYGGNGDGAGITAHIICGEGYGNGFNHRGSG